MNIAIIGVGGIGGYFGGKIAKYANDHNVYFVARGAHLEAIIENGLELETVEGTYSVRPTMATDDISGLPFLDVCLVCVKGYDLDKVMLQLSEVITAQTVILPLLNGVDIVERIRKVTNKGQVSPACVYVGTHIEKPGKVKQKGGACTIHYGENEVLRELFEKSEIKSIAYQDPYEAIWEKYIFIAAYGMVTAATNNVLGAVMEDESLAKDVQDIMCEIAMIAKASGVTLSESIVSDSFEKGNKFPYEAKTSFQRDYENPDKKDERDLFGDTIVRLGKDYDILTPTTQKYVMTLQC